jgi:hypothetical protein
MGIIGNSIKREFGKNTGKVVSNILFGDMHSTPYRRVDSARVRATEAKIERQYKEQLFAIDNAVLENIDAVASYRISNEKEELLHQLSELSVQLKANNWRETLNSEEAKVRNKFCDALFEKYKQCLRTLEAIAPDEPQLGYYKKIRKKTSLRKYIRTYPTLIGAGLLMIFGSLAGWISTLDKNELNLLLAIVIAVVVITISLMIYFKTRSKKIKKEKSSQRNQLKQETIIPFEQSSEVDNSIFIDLNENNRIELSLTRIWSKYKNIIDKQIISRRPIFSADGVKESILFVGVNPSYNPSDDKICVESNDKKSLMYGSFYQRLDAPDYFKTLEQFADQMNVGYTHINLLYARENDRDLLLKSNQDFIREQLELTYETIKKINPVAIIFFSDYCKSLIFGEERWISPKSEVDEHFRLKGTNFPVFFTDDISILNSTEQNELIQRIQQVI